MAEDILSYIDQLNPTSALIGASNMLLNSLQNAGVVPRPGATTSTRNVNKGTGARNKRRGTGIFSDPLSRRDQYGGSRDMDAGPGRVSFMSERTAPAVLNGVPGIVDVNPQTGKMLPGTWRRGDMDAGPGLVSEMNDPSQADYIAPPPAPILPPPSNLPPEDRAYQREAARTQQMMAANPYMPQMNLYAQGQRAMQTPEDMAATRDLGLAINRAMYGDMTTPKTANPLMAGLNPPGSTQPVIPMDEEGRIGQLDTAAEGVQEFMRKYAEGMKKRKGEE